MCWICDHPGSTRDDYLDMLRTIIAERGWAVQYVEDDRRPFAYTIGLWDNGIPELLVTGVSPQRARRLLNWTAGRVLHGGWLTPGRQFTVPAGPVVEAVEVAQPDAHMGLGVAVVGPDVRALQLVWADGRGRWPWSADFCDGGGRQPVLGVRAGNC